MTEIINEVTFGGSNDISVFSLSALGSCVENVHFGSGFVPEKQNVRKCLCIKQEQNHIHTHTLSLALTHSRTRTHTHTLTHAHTHTHTHTLTMN